MDELVEVEKKMTRRGKWLCRAGWAAFAASLALPAVAAGEGWVFGWECFRWVYDIARGVLTLGGPTSRDGWMIYYSVFALVNSLLVVSPFLIRWFRGKRAVLKRIAVLEVLASLYAGSFLITGLFSDGLKAFTELNTGYYVWTLSFGLVAAGAQHLALGVRNQNVNQTPLVTRRTKEELLALQELEAYLGGSEAPIKQPDVIAQPAPCQTENQADRQAEELPNRVTWALGLSY